MATAMRAMPRSASSAPICPALCPRGSRRARRGYRARSGQEFLLGLHSSSLPSSPEHPPRLPRAGHTAPRPEPATPQERRADGHGAEPHPRSTAPPRKSVRLRRGRRWPRCAALSAEDRIALKLTATPRPSTRTSSTGSPPATRTSREAVRVLALRAKSTEARAQLFDGAVQPPREADAGRAIDRFHKRVSRARQRFLARAGGNP